MSSSSESEPLLELRTVQSIDNSVATDASVTVSIVSHLQWSMVQPLIEQLDRLCAETVREVVLTVNLPEDVQLDPLWRVRVEVVTNNRPKGFGANHNQAFRRCQTPWFLVLNPDIRLASDVIGALTAAARPDAGLIAPRIWEPDQRVAEPFRSILTPLELVSRRLPWREAPRRPDWVAGMFMLLRREAFDQVGGFDERFFMYCEDFDLCARLRLAGWQLQVGDASVLHIAQRASQKSWRPLLWHLTSLAKVWTSGAFWSYAAQLHRDRRLQGAKQESSP